MYKHPISHREAGTVLGAFGHGGAGAATWPARRDAAEESKGRSTNPGSLQPSPRETSTLDVGSSCLETLGDKGEINYRILANPEPVSLPRKPALFRRKQACFLRCPPPPSRGPRGPKTEVRALPGGRGCPEPPRRDASQRSGVQAETPDGEGGVLGEGLRKRSRPRGLPPSTLSLPERMRPRRTSKSSLPKGNHI